MYANRWGLTQISRSQEGRCDRGATCRAHKDIVFAGSQLQEEEEIRLIRSIPDLDVLSATKVTHKKAVKVIESVKLADTMEGAEAFELYGNLFSYEARQPWEKIIKAQMTCAPWEDVYGVAHAETPTKTWDSFWECIMFHLLQVF